MPWASHRRRRSPFTPRTWRAWPTWSAWPTRWCEALGGAVGETLYVAGGGTQSAAGLQIRADVLGKRLRVPEVPAGAMGAAILAARGCAFAQRRPRRRAAWCIAARRWSRASRSARAYGERYRALCGRLPRARLSGMSIFKDCDIRGVYGPELDERTAYRLGRAVATRLRGRSTWWWAATCASARPALKAALIDGLVPERRRT